MPVLERWTTAGGVTIHSRTELPLPPGSIKLASRQAHHDLGTDGPIHGHEVSQAMQRHPKHNPCRVLCDVRAAQCGPAGSNHAVRQFLLSFSFFLLSCKKTLSGLRATNFCHMHVDLRLYRHRPPLQPRTVHQLHESWSMDHGPRAVDHGPCLDYHPW